MQEFLYYFSHSFATVTPIFYLVKAYNNSQTENVISYNNLGLKFKLVFRNKFG